MNRVTEILSVAVIFILGISGLAGCEVETSARGNAGPEVAAAGLASSDPASHPGASAGESYGIVVRRVWGSRAVDLTGDVTYDGRALVFVDYATGDVAVRDLRSGETRRITNKGSWEESGDYAMDPKVSRDGEKVAFTWAIQRGNTEFHELRMMNLDGTGLRTLYHDESIGWINPITWYPDGRHLLAMASREGGPDQILQISVPDGTSRILMSPAPQTPRPEPVHMSFSPDARFLAFDRIVDEESGNRDIYVMAADGTREHRIVEDPAEDLLLGWAPDGRHLLFASDRQGTLGAWLLPVQDGNPSGEPILVRPDLWRMAPIGFAADGSFFYGVSTTKRTVWTALLDPFTGDVLPHLYSVDQPASGSRQDSHAFWSPDGRFMAYQSVRGPSGAERPVTMVQSMETGETREFTPRGVDYVAPRLWSRDGAFVLGFGRDEEGRRGFFRINVLTGETRPLANFWSVDMSAPLGESPGGESLYYTVSLDGGTGIAARAMDGGPGEILWRAEALTADLSPDGRYLAIGQIEADSCSLVLLSTAGAGAEVLVRFPPGEGGPEQISWTPDGETIVYRNDRQIWSIPRVGGTPRRLEWPIDTDLVVGMRNIEFSPDGGRIAFDAESGEEELWVMENFLPGH